MFKNKFYINGFNSETFLYYKITKNCNKNSVDLKIQFRRFSKTKLYQIIFIFSN